MGRGGRVLDADWYTQAQAGRTSESVSPVSPAPTSTRSTHTQHAQSQQLGCGAGASVCVPHYVHTVIKAYMRGWVGGKFSV